MSFVLILAAILFTEAGLHPPNALTQQFVYVDSVLAELAVRSQEIIEKPDAAAKIMESILGQQPSISALALIDGRGKTVIKAPAAAPDQFVGDSADTRREWYRVPRDNHKPYYSELLRYEGRYCVVWSKPVISHTLGLRRLAGVVAAVVDLETCLQQFSRTYGGPFELLRGEEVFHQSGWKPTESFDEEPVSIMGGIEFSMRFVKRPEGAAAAGRAPDTGADLSGASTAVHARPVDEKTPLLRKLFSPGFSVALGILLLGVVVAATVFKSRRGNDEISDEERGKIVAEEQDRVRKIVIAQIYCDLKTQIVKHESKKIERDVREQLVEELRTKLALEELASIRDELRVELKNAATGEVRESLRREILDSQREALEKEVRDAVLDELAEQVRERERDTVTARVIGELTDEIRNEVRRDREPQLREQLIAELTAGMRARMLQTAEQELMEQARNLILDEMKRLILRDEGEQMAREIRDGLREDLRSGIAATEHEDLREAAREDLRQELKKDLEQREGERMIAEERDRLAAQIRRTMEEKYREQIAGEVRERLAHEIGEELGRNEGAAIAERERERLTAAIREELDKESGDIEQSVREQITAETETRVRSQEMDEILDGVRARVAESILDTHREKIVQEQRDRLERDIYQELTTKEQGRIRDRVLHEMRTAERQRIEREEMDGLVEGERQRLIAERHDEIAGAVRDEIYREELERIRRDVGNEIRENETAEIKAKLEKTFDQRVQKEAAAVGRQLEKRFKASLQAAIHDAAAAITGRLSEVSDRMEHVDALHSFEKTLGMLNEEHNKFRYYNLNAGQTRSLLEYLNRLYGQFSDQFANLDDAVKNIRQDMSGMLAILDPGTQGDLREATADTAVGRSEKA